MSEHILDQRTSGGVAGWLRKLPGVAVMLVAMLVIFTATSPGFASGDNVRNIIQQSIILLLVALPMTLIIMTEGIDLSMGAMLTLITIVYAMTVVATNSVLVGLLAALGGGFAFGLVNGWLIAMVGIPPFVATLGTLGIGQGLSLILTDGQSVVGLPRDILFPTWVFAWGLPLSVLIATLFYAAMHGILYHTKFGNYIAALGGNRDALRQAGVNDSFVLMGVYVLGGVSIAIAAPLLCARMNSAHPTAAIGMEFDAIAAAAVGGTQFERGNGWLFGTLLGVVAIGTLRNGLNLLAVPSSVQVSCVGLLVILALLLDGLRSANR
jgi:ribose transport system permease protein